MRRLLLVFPISHFPATSYRPVQSVNHTHTYTPTHLLTHTCTWGKLNEACVIDFMFVKNGRKRSTLDWPFDDSSLSICLQYSWHSISIELQKSRQPKEMREKKTNFVGLQRVKCIKWPLTGKKQNLSFNRKQKTKKYSKKKRQPKRLSNWLPNSQSVVASSKWQVAVAEANKRHHFDGFIFGCIVIVGVASWVGCLLPADCSPLLKYTFLSFPSTSHSHSIPLLQFSFHYVLANPISTYLRYIVGHEFWVVVFYLYWYNTYNTEREREREMENILKVPRRTSTFWENPDRGKRKERKKRNDTDTDHNSHYHYQSVYFVYSIQNVRIL